MTTDLNALAARVEQLSGRDREMDALIWEACFHEQYWSVVRHRDGARYLRYYPGPPGPELHSLPAYTVSLDAAMTLVPKGWGGILGIGKSGVTNLWQSRSGKDRGVFAKSNINPARALTAAALRARASGDQRHE